MYNLFTVFRTMTLSGVRNYFGLYLYIGYLDALQLKKFVADALYYVFVQVELFCPGAVQVQVPRAGVGTL